MSLMFRDYLEIMCYRVTPCCTDFIPYERTFILVFRETTPSTWNYRPNWPRRWKNGNFQSIFAPCTLAVLMLSSEKKSSYKSLIRSPLRAFEWV